MRKLLLVLFLIPFCCTITVGCGGSGENTVIEPGAETVDEAAEEAMTEEDTETPTD
jgi:hypothetical protein